MPIAPKRRRVSTVVMANKRRRTTAASKINKSNRTIARVPRSRGPLRAQVASLRRAMSGLAPEMKYLDVDVTAADITTAGSVIHVTQIAQGDGLGNRAGNSIKLRTISFRGNFVRTSVGATPTAGAFYRLALVVDKQQVVDASPATVTIFDGGAVTLQMNIQTLKRFNCLWLSRIYDPQRMVMDTDQITANGVVPTEGVIGMFDWSGNMEVRYNGSATSDIQKNGVHFVIISNDSNNTLDFSGSVRLGFTDA